jgi:autophagy-related protein 9
MASNILSRLLPSASDEALPRRPSHTSADDVESNAAMAIDEENLNEPFQDQDLEQLLAEAAESEAGTEATPFVPVEKGRRRSSGSKRTPKWMKESRKTGMDDDDDDVPQSLMLQGGNDAKPKREGKERRLSANARDHQPPPPLPVPGPSTMTAQAQWEATRTQQRLYDHAPGPDRHTTPSRLPGAGILTANPRERALWRWANVENLDGFLYSVYYYYAKDGIWSICLRRLFGLL